jgi:hypothetical protein
MNRVSSALDHPSRCLLMLYDLRTRGLLLLLLLLLLAGGDVTGAPGAMGLLAVVLPVLVVSR